MSDFLFRGTLQELDPQVHELNELEAERQYRRLILIPSESTSPLAVREALGSAFHNIYAEGYPDQESRWYSEEEILDYPERLAHYRRYSDPRYYKGTEYANTVEALARRRCAETFAANGVTADDLYVNVQALSGGPANNAVYHALVQPGETVMGLDLLHGGHLSHGSKANRSGKYYNIVHYSVDPESEILDYESIEELAKEHNPKMIIGGISSYPWQIDWESLRRVADSVGAYLLADMAHVAGLVAAGEYPSPIGHAHVVTSTTHKTLCGPRGAIILTTDKKLSDKIDRAVFPGEQGGPHVNVFSALALTFKLAQTKQFKQLQQQTVKNCITLTKQLKKRGFRIPFGGTNTHLMNLDTKSVTLDDGIPLSGDMAARILELAGIVVNRNTIPGDKSALNPMGIRMGTPWITQRGFAEKETKELADIIADVLFACTPYKLRSKLRRNLRAKVDFDVLSGAKLRIRKLAENAGIDFTPPTHGYPHYYYIDRKSESSEKAPNNEDELNTITLSGERVRSFLNIHFSTDIELLRPGENQPTSLVIQAEEIFCNLTCSSDYVYELTPPTDKLNLVSEWLRACSDGFVQIDSDVEIKSPGPINIHLIASHNTQIPDTVISSLTKPFYIGMGAQSGDPLLQFDFSQEKTTEIKQTPLHKLHQELGAKMAPFAGWDMPLQYSSVSSEHAAVRTAAGLFDVAHMGVFRFDGPVAAAFLDSVCATNMYSIGVGRSTYSHLLDPDANVIDDVYIYRTGTESYIMVVNAANTAKDWAWLSAVKNGEVLIETSRPWVKSFGRNTIIRNLHNSSHGEDQLVLLALQGPNSGQILKEYVKDSPTKKAISKMVRNDVITSTSQHDLIIARTGYTGEKIGYEIFIHPDHAAEMWNALLKVGEAFGIKPCGLASRDSLRVEAGLPLYANELAGPLNLGAAEAGFRKYVKTYKPWFIGRKAYIAREGKRKDQLVRFRFDGKRVRVAHIGDPVVDTEGNAIGHVTSCALDSQRRLIGQAVIDRKFIKKGTPIHVYQGASTEEKFSLSDPKIKGKAVTASQATVISRFL